MNEAAPGAQQAKWGYVSEAPGDELLLRIAHAGRGLTPLACEVITNMITPLGRPRLRRRAAAAHRPRMQGPDLAVFLRVSHIASVYPSQDQGLLSITSGVQASGCL